MMRRELRFETILALAFGGAISSFVSFAWAADGDDEHEDDKRGSTKAALDLEYVFVTSEKLDNGAGGAVRLGREFDAVLISITPEIGGSYHSLDGVFDASLYRGFAGLRLSLGKLIEPGIFGHVGYGYIAFQDIAGAFDESHGALSYDVGATLDLTLLPVLDVGIHGAYNGLTGDSRFKRVNWVNAGGHVSVQF
jgi:hypothetical protein